MIGIDLLYRGVPVQAAERYLGSPADAWVTLALGDLYARLRARGWDVPVDLDPTLLIAAMREERLPRIPGWEPPAGEVVHEVVPPESVEVPLQAFRCARRGHEWRARGVYRWETATEPVRRSAPLCPFCVVDFATLMFGVVGDRLEGTEAP